MFSSCTFGPDTIDPHPYEASLVWGRGDANIPSQPGWGLGTAYLVGSATQAVAPGNHKVDSKDESKSVVNAWAEAGKGLTTHFEV